jgi:NAD(P)-dependent dehydrogenase (short-subunit alcohol dehydrogenase family)
MGRVDGKVALITGGGSGIGEAACRTLVREGAAVAVVDYRLDAAEAIAKELTDAGGRAIAIQADVRKEPEMQAAVRRTVSELGGIPEGQEGGLHFVFANAGINGMQCPIEEMTLEEWYATIDTNLTGTFLTVKPSIPHLRAAGGGSIAITASVNGTHLFSAAGYSAYSSSKAAQLAYGKMAAQELGRWDIRVNVIIPGAIRTNIGERTYRRNLEKTRWDLKMPERFPPHLGRPADASEVADLVLFLASDESRYITGSEVVIDAGLSLIRG